VHTRYGRHHCSAAVASLAVVSDQMAVVQFQLCHQNNWQPLSLNVSLLIARSDAGEMKLLDIEFEKSATVEKFMLACHPSTTYII
jgi:hypothetical protein